MNDTGEKSEMTEKMALSSSFINFFGFPNVFASQQIFHECRGLDELRKELNTERENVMKLSERLDGLEKELKDL